MTFNLSDFGFISSLVFKFIVWFSFLALNISLEPNTDKIASIMPSATIFQISLSKIITAKIPKRAVIAYNITTACLWESPASISLWCIWPLSACIIDLWCASLLQIAKSVSNIGSPSITTGNTIVITVYVLARPIIESVAKTNPKKFEPASPIKVLAGLKLYGKNPINPPSSAATKTIAISLAPFKIKITSNDNVEIAETPVARPSNPSIKFIAFVTPTSQK